MYCPACGQEVPDEAKFCGNCRHQLKQAQSAAPDSQENTSQQQEAVVVDTTEPEVSPGLKWGILAATIFIPLIGFVMGLVYLLQQNNSEEKKSVGKMWLITSIVLGVIYVVGSSGY